MRVSTLRLKNFLAHKDTAIDFGTPKVAVIVGPNEAGKSSIVDAIRWSLLNRARGLTSRDNRLLVHRGADTCKVDLSIRHGDRDGVVSRTPSGGTPSQEAIRQALGIPDDLALEAALDAGRFLDMAPKERRALAFKLAGAEVTSERLRAEGIDDDGIVHIALHKGFDAAERAATEKKRAAARAAEELVVTPPVDEEVQVGEKKLRLSAVPLDQAVAALATIRRQRDAARDAVTAAEAEHRRASGDQESLGRLRAELEAAERALAAAEAKAAAGAKERGDPAALRARAEQLVAAMQEAPVSQPTPPAIEPVPDIGGASAAVELRRSEVQRATANPWRRVEAAGERLVQLGGEAENVGRELLDLARTQGGDLAALQAAKQAAVEALEALSARADAARRRNEDAQAAHRGALELYDRRRAERDARVTAARIERQKLLDDAGRIEAVAAADQRALSSERARVESLRARVAGLDESSADADDLPDLEDLRARATAIDKRLADGEAFTSRVRGYHEALARLGTVERRRAELAAEAARYERMEKALRPTGVMAQLVAGPLGRLREALDTVARGMLGKTLRVTDEWDVLYDDAPVSLASTSTRWRIGAALAIALGVVSGLRWAVLDEASVCVGETRGRLLAALLAATDHFDQLIVVGSRSEAEMATLVPPDERVAHLVGLWRVEAGRVSRVELAAATAAA